jgi:hypothetical protein
MTAACKDEDVRAEIIEEIRSILDGDAEVTLDGRRAAISGFTRPFGTVSLLNGSGGHEWSWESIRDTLKRAEYPGQFVTDPDVFKLFKRKQHDAQQLDKMRRAIERFTRYARDPVFAKTAAICLDAFDNAGRMTELAATEDAIQRIRHAISVLEDNIKALKS